VLESSREGKGNNRRTCDITLWLDELDEIRLDERHPLLYAALEISSTFFDVAHDFAN
jgi:hypothetical protein